MLQLNIFGKRFPGFSFKATLDNREIPEWFHHKNSSGNHLCFDIPLGDNFAGVTFWVVCKYLDVLREKFPKIEAIITNKTEGTPPHIHTMRGEGPFTWEGDVVRCINGDKISVKSGDRIEVSFQFPFCHTLSEVRYVKMCGVHIIHKEI